MSEKSNFKELSIVSSSHEYKVRIGSGLFEDFIRSFDGFVITDSRFSELLTRAKIKGVVQIEALEENKNLAEVERVMIELKNQGMTRGDVLVAVGGGIVQDLATLTASLYMRGVKWLYFPTTFLGMTDSCIGGKSSINAGVVKNLVGNIYPPSEIGIDVDFISTLSERDLLGGITEAAKIAFCKGPKSFEKFLELIQNRSKSGFEQTLHFVLAQKKWFIEIDEFDRRERKQLNFGHTFGHALESATDHLVPHGIAVALGIVAAIKFVAEERELSEAEIELLSLMSQISNDALDLKQIENQVSWEKYLEAFNGDKKHNTNSYNLILPLPNGGVEVRPMRREEETLIRVERAQKLAFGGTK